MQFLQVHLEGKKQQGWKHCTMERVKGPRLSGAECRQLSLKELHITIQWLALPLFKLVYRVCESISGIRFFLSKTEKNIWLEANLTDPETCAGKQPVSGLPAGYYQFYRSCNRQLQLAAGTAASAFEAEFNQEFLGQMGIGELLDTTDPLPLPPEMYQLIREMLTNPYTEPLRSLYYENQLRQLLFLHLSMDRGKLPAALSPQDLSRILEARGKIEANLNRHLTIAELAYRVGTNENKLKQGFRALFGKGAFACLLEGRMKEACRLLDTTRMPIAEVAHRSGYKSVAAFITAFRQRYGLTPRKWRLRGKS